MNMLKEACDQIISNGCCVTVGNAMILDDVSFTIKEGSLVGVVGPNGGGKTTLFNAILGLTPITQGSLTINGMNPNNVKGIIGYVPQKDQLNWNFPMIHYLLTPLIAITASPWALYVSTAVAYMLGILIMSWTLLKHRPFSELLIFSSLSLTHVWSLYYSSFPWPPNYIPLFVSLFLYVFFIT